MKGVGVSDGAECDIRLDAWESPSGDTLLVSDVRFLRSLLRRWMAFDEEHGVPVRLSEFGTHRTTFGEKNGLQWVENMITVLEEGGMNWLCWSCHEPSFEVYDGAETAGYPNPAALNVPLRDLFVRTLQ